MNRLFIKYILVFGFIGFSALLSNAQDDPKFDEQIEIVKAYKPKIGDADRLRANPVNEELKIEKPKLSYYTPLLRFNIKSKKDQLPAVSLGKSKLDPLNRLYGRLSFGNYSDIRADIAYNSLRNKDLNYAALLSHHSGNGPVDNSQFGDQKLFLSGEKLFNDNRLDANLFLRNRTQHYYGTDTLDVPKDSLRQRYTNFGFNTSFENDWNDTNKVGIALDAGMNYLTALSGGEEINFRAGGQILERLNGNDVNINADYNFLQYNNQSTYPRNILRIGANYAFNFHELKAQIGFKSAAETDRNNSFFRFYPDVHLSFPFKPEMLNVFAGITGDLDINSYQSFIDQNDFIGTSDINIQNTNRKFQVFAGADGSLFNRVNYLLEVRYQNIDNLPLFLNDSAQFREFRVIYDSATTTLFSVGLEASYQVFKQLDIHGGLDFYDYNLSSEAEPWHLPSVEYFLNARYNLKNKIGVQLGFWGLGARETLMQYENKADEIVSLDPFFDLNLGVDYRFSKSITAFIRLNNILAQPYEVYNRYRLRGFQFVGGVRVNLL